MTPELPADPGELPPERSIPPCYMAFTLDRENREIVACAVAGTEGEARLESFRRTPPDAPLMLLKLHEYKTLREQIYYGLQKLGLTEAQARKHLPLFVKELASLLDRKRRGTLFTEANKPAKSRPVKKPVKKRRPRKKGNP